MIKFSTVMTAMRFQKPVDNENLNVQISASCSSANDYSAISTEERSGCRKSRPPIAIGVNEEVLCIARGFLRSLAVSKDSPRQWQM